MFFPRPGRKTQSQSRSQRLSAAPPILNGICRQFIYWTITYLSGFSLLLHLEYQLDHVPVVWKGKTMRFKASCVTGSRADLIGARAIKRLGLIAAMMIYWYSPPLRAMEENLVVTIDQARVVNVPTGTESLVVGNAALDAAGNPLSQSLIHVVGGSNSLLVQRGMDRQSYACEPPSRQCQPTVKLGDDAKYFGDIAKQVTDHNTQATGLP
jgi:hypothetical protein